jgi:hypothetical protein
MSVHDQAHREGPTRSLPLPQEGPMQEHPKRRIPPPSDEELRERERAYWEKHHNAPPQGI